MVDYTTGLSFTTTSLAPGFSDEFKLYTDLDTLNAVATTTEASSSIYTYSVEALVGRVGNDLTQLSESAFDEIQSTLREIFTTSEVANLQTGAYVFVEDAETIEYTPGFDIMTPFETSDGSGQGVTVTSDSNTSVLTYVRRDDKRNHHGLWNDRGRWLFCGRKQ